MCKVHETRWPEVLAVFFYRFARSTLVFLFSGHIARFSSLDSRAIGKAITPDVDHKSNWQSIPLSPSHSLTLSSQSLFLFHLLSLLFFPPFCLLISVSLLQKHKHTPTHTQTRTLYISQANIYSFLLLQQPTYKIRKKSVYLYSKASFSVSRTYPKTCLFSRKQLEGETKFHYIY